MMRKLLTALTVSVAVFLSASCTDGSSIETRSRNTRPDPAWVTAISLHSNGAISRHSPIRVLFTSDVIGAERVGTDASANIRITARGEGARRVRQPARNRAASRNRVRARHAPTASRCWRRD